MFAAAGYQYVNLGKKAYDSSWTMRQYYDKVEGMYPDFKINKLAFIGPEEELMREDNGIVVNAVYQKGIYDILKEYKVSPEQIMGYKSGELMALVCAQVISFDDAINFIFKKRKMVVDEVGREYFCHMLVNTAPVVQVEKIIAELKAGTKAEIVSYNGRDSTIVECETKMKTFFAGIFKKIGGAVIELPYEEFACLPFLKPIAEKLKDDFLKIPMDKPVHRIICQTTGEYYENVQEIKDRFLDYIWKPSRIDLALGTMLKNGINTFVEIGPGTFLSRMSRKTDPGKRSLNTNDLGELSKTVKLAN
jgi:[acyl-carrier-protein] S-malonyltransferase